MIAALQFLTRIPIRLRRAPDLSATVPWFPLAGAVIGAAVGGTAAGLWHLVPPAVAAAVAMCVGLLITGAFHEDGLADTADAFGGGWTVERRLEILKDSRHGTYGVAALCASILLRTISLASLRGPWAMFAAAVAMHTFGRVAAVALAALGPMSTHPGLGTDFGRATRRAPALAGIVAGIAVVAAVVGARRGGTLANGGLGPWRTSVAALLLAALVAAIAVGALARRKVGGLSGDILGCAEQVAECLVIVTWTAR